MMELHKGPAIVAIGGGHGLSSILRGLKLYTDDLTAIVTVADDGGGSGMLREDLSMPPPGDIRNCMEALADTESIMQRLLSYRFGSGRLAGQAFGNLLLAALNGISGSFDEAVARMSDVLAITGRILPVTNANVVLEATFENGTSVQGESRIFSFKKAQNCRIREVRLLPENSPALPAALEAIRQADVVLLGPGSLYTSVVPNLLVDGIADAIRNSRALKIYVCNIMTQDGETEGLSASEHVAALFRHGGEGIVDICLCNDRAVPRRLLERYSREDAEPMRVDVENLERLGVQVVQRDLLDLEIDYARHSGVKVAETVLDLYRDCAETRIF
ncbi:MAG: YvcK family protein [Oscillospiraceae bacterium]|nr:YvcK family protein [Oscillospiraceae bacterium]